MELLLTLKDKDLLYKLNNDIVDGVIFGSSFSHKYNYSEEELHEINDYCQVNNYKRYISIDCIIDENQLQSLYQYLDMIVELKPDGVYFTDLAIYNYFKKKNIENLLIYDPVTLNTNCIDISFFINNNVGALLAREITLEEIANIIKHYPNKIDMQIFGHLRMSYSKRKFLTNYFEQINKPLEVTNNKNINIQEESRNFNFPIVENEYGTSIYTDYCFVMYSEIVVLQQLLKRGIIDTDFLPDSLILEVLRNFKRLTLENGGFLESTIKNNYNNIIFSNGYLYQKTIDKKDNDE